MQVGNNRSHTVYLKQETKMWVADKDDPQEIFNGKYFSYAADLLNTVVFETYGDESLAKKEMPYNYEYFMYKVTYTEEDSKQEEIRISDIQGLFYATVNGNVKYVENPQYHPRNPA